jgi:hypothetical protein
MQSEMLQNWQEFAVVLRKYPTEQFLHVELVRHSAQLDPHWLVQALLFGSRKYPGTH